MKRFTGTEKWSKAWFRKLSPKLKCMWFYLCDTCDCAGLWDCDFEAAGFFIGESVTEEEILENFGDKLHKVGNKFLVIPFVEFQYGPLNPESRPHKGVMDRLEKENIALTDGLPDLNKRVSKGLRKAIKTYQENPEGDKDKDKDKDKEGESEGGKNKDPLPIPENLKTPEFIRQWQIWMNHRRGYKKPSDWGVMFRSQLEFLSRFDPEVAVEVLSQSIRNGWQGLFEPKGNPINGKSHPSTINGAEMIVRQKELERIEFEMKSIRGQYGDHQTWTEDDKVKFKEFRNRRNELREILGVKI